MGWKLIDRSALEKDRLIHLQQFSLGLCRLSAMGENILVTGSGSPSGAETRTVRLGTAQETDFSQVPHPSYKWIELPTTRGSWPRSCCREEWMYLIEKMEKKPVISLPNRKLVTNKNKCWKILRQDQNVSDSLSALPTELEVLNTHIEKTSTAQPRDPSQAVFLD